MTFLWHYDTSLIAGEINTTMVRWVIKRRLLINKTFPPPRQLRAWETQLQYHTKCGPRSSSFSLNSSFWLKQPRPTMMLLVMLLFMFLFDCINAVRRKERNLQDHITKNENKYINIQTYMSNFLEKLTDAKKKKLFVRRLTKFWFFLNILQW